MNLYDLCNAYIENRISYYYDSVTETDIYYCDDDIEHQKLQNAFDSCSNELYVILNEMNKRMKTIRCKRVSNRQTHIDNIIERLTKSDIILRDPYDDLNDISFDDSNLYSMCQCYVVTVENENELQCFQQTHFPDSPELFNEQFDELDDEFSLIESRMKKLINEHYLNECVA